MSSLTLTGLVNMHKPNTNGPQGRQSRQTVDFLKEGVQVLDTCK